MLSTPSNSRAIAGKSFRVVTDNATWLGGTEVLAQSGQSDVSGRMSAKSRPERVWYIETVRIGKEQMEKHVQERFERIETILEQIAIAHLDLEASQKNTTVALNRLTEESRVRGREVDERIANLAILVDQLIKGELGR
jgi:hypothetical protein